MKRTFALVTCFALAALLFSIVPLGADAAQVNSIYVVRSGDTLYSIASRYCMSPQELYSLNTSVISNPNQLYPGMQLRVINRCGGGGGGGGGGANCPVYDRGPRPHAMGFVQGNMYTVAQGDTAFSIGQRFGISSTALGQANGLNPWMICAGQRLVIPGLGQCQMPCSGWNCQPPCTGWNCQQPCTGTNCQQPCTGTNCQQPCSGNNCQQPCSGWNCQPCTGWNCCNGQFCPTPVPPITPIPITPSPTTQPVQPVIQITSPAANATLPPTFTVTGTGQGLFEGSLVVRAQDNVGNILVQQPVTLQGTNVGAGGPGTFSVQLTVNVPNPTVGFIVAFAPQTPAAPAVSVPVTFSPSGGGGGTTYKTYNAGQCTVTVSAGQQFFATPGGAATGSFANTGTYAATRGAKQNNRLWFEVGPVPATTTQVWVPMTGVSLMTPGCYW